MRDKIGMLEHSEVPINEQGLDSLMEKNVAAVRLTAYVSRTELRIGVAPFVDWYGVYHVG